LFFSILYIIFSVRHSCWYT